MASSNLTGNYLLTITARGLQGGGTACVTLTENGSVDNWANSGTVTSAGYSGQFFIVGRELTAWITLPTGYDVFSGNLEGGVLSMATVAQVSGSTGIVTGTYTAKKNGC